MNIYVYLYIEKGIALRISFNAWRRTRTALLGVRNLKQIKVLGLLGEALIEFFNLILVRQGGQRFQAI